MNMKERLKAGEASNLIANVITLGIIELRIFT